jgi:transcriptional regulator GlxA family with amidase domain
LRAKALEGLIISIIAIADIALACGFDSLGHPYRRFRTFNDETLEQYRQRQTAAVQVNLGAHAF